MKRILFLTVSVASIVLVVSQVCFGIYLKMTGSLTMEKVWEIQALLEDQTSSESSDESMASTKPEFSIEELMQERAVRVFDLEDRERELGRLASLVLQRRDETLKEKNSLETRRKQFARELETLRENETSDATTLAQGVLLAVPPQDAVRDLMQLSLDHDIALLKGMPVKSIGKILKEFHQGDELQRQRGAEIFEALAAGNPAVQLIDQEIGQLK